MVLFSAAKTSTQSVSVGDIIEFADVATNIGNAYSSLRSTFTFPYSDMYVFHYHLMSSLSFCGGRLRKDGVDYFGAYSSDFSTWDSASNSMFLDCDERSEITVVAYTGGSCYGESTELSSFSGQFLGFTNSSLSAVVN